MFLVMKSLGLSFLDGARQCLWFVPLFVLLISMQVINVFCEWSCRLNCASYYCHAVGAGGVIRYRES